MTKPGRKAFARGALGMGVALLVLYSLETLFPRIQFPPARAAALVVRFTPGGIATEMIERLGHWALLLLGLVVGVVAIALGGLIAMRISRGGSEVSRARLALGAAVLIVIVAVVLGIGAVQGQGVSVLAVVAYALAAYLFIRIGTDVKLFDVVPRQIQPGETPLDAMDRGRRRFVVAITAAVVGLIVGGAAALRSRSRKTSVPVKIAEVAEPFELPPPDPAFPDVPGLVPEITPTAQFYNVDIHLVKPMVNHDGWKLKVTGLVGRPYELTYQQLQSDFEVVELAHTLTCISNEVGGDLISTAIWRGVRLKDVLQRAALASSGVVDIVFRGVEGYSDSIPVAKALEDTTLVVFGMNGEPLPREHGFPARMIVPGIYGMKNVKWLGTIEAVDHNYQGYWMVRGWSDVARIKTSSRIDVPLNDSEVALPAKAAGVAWAGDRGISNVEVSQDGGRSWVPAVLKRELSAVAWRLWAADLEPGRGRRRLLVRSTDGSGEVQSSQVTEPHPSGASGLHEVEIDLA